MQADYRSGVVHGIMTIHLHTIYTQVSQENSGNYRKTCQTAVLTASVFFNENNA